MRHILHTALRACMPGLLGLSAPDVYSLSAPREARELADFDRVQEKKAVSALYALGLIRAVRDGGLFRFDPTGALTHEEMVAATAAAAKTLGLPAAALEAHFDFTPPLNREQAARVLFDAMCAEGMT